MLEATAEGARYLVHYDSRVPFSEQYELLVISGTESFSTRQNHRVVIGMVETGPPWEHKRRKYVTVMPIPPDQRPAALAVLHQHGYNPPFVSCPYPMPYQPQKDGMMPPRNQFFMTHDPRL